jgi:hypothetical protein
MNTDKIFSLTTPSEDEMKAAHINYMNWLMNNPNNFSYWFPRIKDLREWGISIPKSIIIPVPETILRAFYMDHMPDDMNVITKWVDAAVMPFISTEFANKDVFVKNGCFSNKFSFNAACHIPADADLVKVTDNICRIQADSICFDTAGNLEIVLREWIEPEEGTRTIYNGMPFRSEMRLFYDFTNHRYLYDVNYWDWDYCHDHICSNPEDAEVYEEDYQCIAEELDIRKNIHLTNIANALDSVNSLRGIWSVDFILTDDKCWLIDMAVAKQSAYWNENKAFPKS